MSNFMKNAFKAFKAEKFEHTDKTWWVFVWNNPDDKDLPRNLKDVLEVWWQLESGSKRHVPHLQGVAHFAFPKSRTQLREQMPAWWQGMQGTPIQAIRYCTKEETRLEGPFHYCHSTAFFHSLKSIMTEEPKKIGRDMYLITYIGPLEEHETSHASVKTIVLYE